MDSPDSWIEAALEELTHTLAGKNEDYRIDGEFSNFEYAAKISGVDTIDIIMNQLAIKLGRLKGLAGKSFVNNESVLDTYKDLAGYAIIAYAYVASTTSESVTPQEYNEWVDRVVQDDEEWGPNPYAR